LLLVATIRLRTLPLLGWLAPVLRAQVMREANAASMEGKRDIEHGYQPSSRAGGNDGGLIRLGRQRPSDNARSKERAWTSCCWPRPR
jgi:hypothetical protein